MGLVLGTLTLAWAGCLLDTESVGDSSQAVKTDAEVAAECATKPHKQAVCHIPPGNPANAHTICISKSAVDKHVSQHGDYLGACEPTNGSGGAGQGGSASNGGSDSTGSGGSECGPGTDPCTDDSDCVEATCQAGCCLPLVY